MFAVGERKELARPIVLRKYHHRNTIVNFRFDLRSRVSLVETAFFLSRFPHVSDGDLDDGEWKRSCPAVSLRVPISLQISFAPERVDSVLRTCKIANPRSVKLAL